MSQATARQFTLRVRGALKSRSACSPDPHAGLARGDEAIGTTVSLVRWQLQPGLAGPLPVPRGLAEESACPSGDRARAAPAPEGWLRWSQQLASGSLASRGLTSGSKCTGGPTQVRKLSTLLLSGALRSSAATDGIGKLSSSCRGDEKNPDLRDIFKLLR